MEGSEQVLHISGGPVLPGRPLRPPFLLLSALGLSQASAGRIVCHRQFSSMAVTWASLAALWNYHPQLTGGFLPFLKCGRGVSTGA